MIRPAFAMLAAAMSTLYAPLPPLTTPSGLDPGHLFAPTPTCRRWHGGTEAPGTFEARVERRRKASKAARKARRVNR